MVVFFLLLILLWVILSGQFSLFFLAFGLISVIITIIINRKLFTPPLPILKINIFAFLKLLKDMFIASLKVGKIIWFNSIEVKPSCILIDVKSLDEKEQAIEANMITLTPGTMSLNLENNKILVHAINEEMVKEIKESRL